MTTILQSRNIAMAELVMSHADLIDEMQMPPSLLALCAHVRYYEALQARWDEGDFARYIPYLLSREMSRTTWWEAAQFHPIPARCSNWNQIRTAMTSQPAG